jgi:hypothetical protein
MNFNHLVHTILNEATNAFGLPLLDGSPEVYIITTSLGTMHPDAADSFDFYRVLSHDIKMFTYLKREYSHSISEQMVLAQFQYYTENALFNSLPEYISNFENHFLSLIQRLHNVKGHYYTSRSDSHFTVYFEVDLDSYNTISHAQEELYGF